MKDVIELKGLTYELRDFIKDYGLQGLEIVIEEEQDETKRAKYIDYLLKTCPMNDYYFKYFENLLVSDTSTLARVDLIKYFNKTGGLVQAVNLALKDDNLFNDFSDSMHELRFFKNVFMLTNLSLVIDSPCGFKLNDYYDEYLDYVFVERLHSNNNHLALEVKVIQEALLDIKELRNVIKGLLGVRELKNYDNFNYLWNGLDLVEKDISSQIKRYISEKGDITYFYPVYKILERYAYNE